MSAAIMQPGMQAPHRKPLPSYAAGRPQQQYPPPPPPPQQDPGFSKRVPSTGSSMPPNGAPPYTTGPPQQAYPQSTRRTPSNATSSTSSTSTTAGLQRATTNSSLTNASNPPRRSTSSRSTASASPTSYVALMRKQKATVWCDRAQHEDPRILAAQRSAKTRAAMEVAGGHHLTPQTRTSTSSTGMVGGVRSKIRHHGAPKASTYTGGTHLVGSVGVPMRLSASEVDEGDSDEEAGAGGQYNKYHARNGSGRSSLGSGKRGHNNSYLGNGSTPPLGHSPVESMGELIEEETPVPGQYGQQQQQRSEDYFGQSGGQGGSGDSIDTTSEERFGNVGGLPQTRMKGGGTVVRNRKTSEELRRRGSVDDRTTTMSGVRLFVANPDLSD
ncbi:hypothetical protein B0A50_03610 [Salinomyces thailandicus]|uniref:Uncharacterized protein n=1 Tax=Salinomyces thailandicus TaxID=706561 RepID=A0A4U0U5A6_9PEZI|nr:hypothetical protein B0A50_03610 [Salinomyces thailandica]